MKKTTIHIWHKEEELQFIMLIGGVIDPNNEAHIVLDDEGLLALEDLISDLLDKRKEVWYAQRTQVERSVDEPQTEPRTEDA
jgi:hypothetical protein